MSQYPPPLPNGQRPSRPSVSSTQSNNNNNNNNYNNNQRMSEVDIGSRRSSSEYMANSRSMQGSMQTVPGTSASSLNASSPYLPPSMPMPTAEPGMMTGNPNSYSPYQSPMSLPPQQPPRGSVFVDQNGRVIGSAPPTPYFAPSQPNPYAQQQGQPQGSPHMAPVSMMYQPSVAYANGAIVGSAAAASANNATRISMAPGTIVESAPPTQTMLRRKATKKKVELKGGKLVVDIPVPEKIMGFGKYQDGQEFTHLRYTAATCDPDDFAKEGYTLRPVMYGRQTELFIVVTMYNEDEHLFTKTITAIFKNIAHLCSRNRSKTWGAEGWKKVVVCIVSDGRKKIHPRVLTALGIMGCYQDGIMKNTVNGKEVASHIFEYTTQVCVDTDLKCRGADKGMVPVQVLFCLKERNQKKINSHRWFFNAFGSILNPNVCILLDVGTKPSSTSLYHLWKAFDNDPRVGGACGEIRAEVGNYCLNLVNPLVAAQNFEYKLSNILDKPLESVFGFISVLPGAFSAYRYAAIKDSYPGVGPLSSYFLGEKMHGGGDIFSANMYLAEDRILCFSIVTKRKEAWILKYVKSAHAETDVPDAVPEFVSQRRRWLNGSFFATVFAIRHFYHVWRSRHSFFRKIALMFLFLYNLLNLIFSWFALGNFYLSFYFLGQSVTYTTDKNASNPNDPFGGHGKIVFDIMRHFYIIAIVIIFVSSMGNRPQGAKFIYTFCFFLFACIMCIMLFMAGWSIYVTIVAATQAGVSLLSQPAIRDIALSLASTYGLYFVSSLLYLDPWHMFTSFIQYLLLVPSFINILMVYAFSNLHDVSWGTKGDNVAATDLGAVVTKTNKDGVQIAEIELPTERQDIDAEYDRLLVDIRNRPQVEAQKRDAKTKQEDYFRSFRTRILLWWIFCNAVLIGIMTNSLVLDYFASIAPPGQAGFYNPYFTFLLWSVVGFAAVRFVGCVVYLIDNLIFS